MTQTEQQPSGSSEREATEAPGRRNERSAISFPYSSLEDAEAVARAVHHWGGNEISQARLATTLETTVKSSGFRTDVAAAKLFGFVDGRGTLSLTPLGYRLVDEQTTAQARVSAFKQVPLFRAILDEHEGKILPGPGGLEAEMVRLGVSPKQSARARQLFQRSAQHAGFFDASPERLVEPLTEGPSAKGDKTSTNDDDQNRPSMKHGNLPPEVVGLIESLLFDGEAWPDETQRAYIESARNILKARAALK